MKITVNYRILRALAQYVARREETRYYLNGVCIQHGVMVATNGRILVAAKQETPDGWKDVIVRHDHIMRLPAWKKRQPTECEIEVNGADVSITYDGMTLTAKSIDCTFPDWRPALPKEWEYEKKAALFQQSVLAPMQSFAKAAGGVGPIIVQQNGENPAWVHMSGVEAVGVAMPMTRDKTVWVRPEWLGEMK